MYSYAEIKHVHLEPATKCNAACPMCARNTCGVTAKGLALTELSLAATAKMFPTSFIEQLEAVDFCGAYGDPAAARELVDIVRYVRSLNATCSLTIFTNGGLRSTRWWIDLGEAIGEHGSAVFAVDGLGDTNAVYRRGVDFNKVMENAAAFISTGAAAQWDFIAFRHNEHQIEDARKLSRLLGFRDFSVKKTARFLKSAYDYVPELVGSSEVKRFPIYAPDGAVTGYLEPPTSSDLVNDTARRYPDLIQRFGSLDALFSSTPIHCRVLDTSSVFVAAQGYTFPCCWTYVQATAPVLYSFPEGVDMQVYDLVQSLGGFGAIDARSHSLRSIVEGPLFQAIESSWGCRSVSEGRLKVCGRVCGIEFPAYADQFANPELIPG